MRIAHLTDLHVTEGPRLDDHAAVLADILERCRAAGIHGTIISGDLAGRTVPHRTTPKERAVLFPFLVGLAHLGPVWVLYGNHDQAPDLDGFEHLAGRWPITVLARAGSKRYQTPAGPLFLYHLAYPTKSWLLRGKPGGLETSTAEIQQQLGQLFAVWSAKIEAARHADPSVPHLFAGHAMVRGSKTSGGEVLAGLEVEITAEHLDRAAFDYGALGHLHARQEMAPRCWYAGSPWRNDHAEQDAKSWHLVDVAPFGLEPATGYSATRYDADERLAARVFRVPTPCRRFVTLDYRWAQPDGEAAPRWTKGGPPTLTEPGRSVTDAEVRMRLTVPEQHAASCPWDEEIERVRALGAHRIQPEKTIEPSIRVRAPEIAEAETNAERAAVFWGVQATPPTDDEQRDALALLADLEQHDDDQIEAAQNEVLKTC